MPTPPIPPLAQAPQLQVLDATQLLQMFKFQTQKISSLLHTVQDLLANQTTNAAQATPTAAPSAAPSFQQFHEQEEEWLEWLQQFEAHILAHNMPDSWIPRQRDRSSCQRVSSQHCGMMPW
ncbi:uncharacterized protein LOC126251975 [Schistocerca nitens]|uniref:uncharacterized protein LOC126251975 n=1 Tax=Schistocerca nitens TaxID=7011 RepID=UPI002117A1C1|nr:uncharacterized protein LOC126251975 [Schistocerca nitens]